MTQASEPRGAEPARRNGPSQVEHHTSGTALPAVVIVAVVIASCVALMLHGYTLAAALASVGAAGALGIRVSARLSESSRQVRNHD